MGELIQQIGGGDTEEPKETRKLFLLFHAKDENFADALENNLSPLVQNKEIEIFRRDKFIAGTDEAEIAAAYDQAYLVLPILSPDFLADTELSEEPLAKASENPALLRPVIARVCDWRENQYLKPCLPLPENGEAITSKHWNTPDDAYFEIVQAIKKIL